MNYYDKSNPTCQACSLERKWNNVGEYKVIDYEVPTDFVVDKVGGIDLLIKDKHGNKYATELKPEGSKETLVRMIAEILTYAALKEEEYKPAICFFKDSVQCKDFCKAEFQNDSAFQYLLSLIDVFYITCVGENSGVVDYIIHNNKEKPIV